MDARGDFTQLNSILLLARIINELFKCYKHLKTPFFPCFSYNKEIVQISQVSKTQLFACLLALLAGWPHFRLVLIGLIGLIISLAISKAELINKKVTIDFFGYFL